MLFNQLINFKSNNFYFRFCIVGLVKWEFYCADWKKKFVRTVGSIVYMYFLYIYSLLYILLTYSVKFNSLSFVLVITYICWILFKTLVCHDFSLQLYGNLIYKKYYITQIEKKLHYLYPNTYNESNQYIELRAKIDSRKYS